MRGPGGAPSGSRPAGRRRTEHCLRPAPGHTPAAPALTAARRLLQQLGMTPQRKIRNSELAAAYSGNRSSSPLWQSIGAAAPDQGQGGAGGPGLACAQSGRSGAVAAEARLAAATDAPPTRPSAPGHGSGAAGCREVAIEWRLHDVNSSGCGCASPRSGKVGAALRSSPAYLVRAGAPLSQWCRLRPPIHGRRASVFTVKWQSLPGPWPQLHPFGNGASRQGLGVGADITITITSGMWF